ncbi:hypothetical protein K3495_g5441 [Podosphaera aphanis]|nr:hypothetical protein K3495_g5441 [Podosphaera aphanis]
MSPWMLPSSPAPGSPSISQLPVFRPSVSEYILPPPQSWSVAYLNSPGVLQHAIRANGPRVAEVFATTSATADPAPPPPVAPVARRPTAPPITPFDGSSKNLRSLCPQLQNQFLDQPECFPDEGSKVRYAYQCLGPEALGKMRSSFRCYEDASTPPEIVRIDQFFVALRQRCQDQGLIERASRTVETLYQRKMKSHDFISIFEDNISDSTYADHDKSQWKTMLERQLSKELKHLLNAASDAPTEYHEFANYLRRKDANIQVINAPLYTVPAQRAVPASYPPSSSTPFSSPVSEPTVSQGGSAIDLDAISVQRLPNGRLTQQAKDARRALGRCVRCNKTGQTTENCTPKFRTLATMDEQLIGEDQLKG